MLKLDIYGLRVRINFRHAKVEKEVARLLKIFLREDLDEVDVSFNYEEKGLPRLIGNQLSPNWLQRISGESMQEDSISMEGILP